MEELWGLVEEAFQYGEEAVQKVIEENYNALAFDLQQSARALLKIAPLHAIGQEAHSSVQARRLKLLQSLSSANPEEVIKTVEQVRQEQRNDLMDVIDLQKYTTEKLNFQHKLNLFIGQQVKTIFVYRGKRGEVVLAEIDSSQVVQEDMMRHTMRYTNQSAIMEAVNRKRAQTTPEELADANNLKVTYREVLYRGNSFKKKLSTENAKRKGTGTALKNQLIILWRSGSEWQRMQVSSVGDINEAYAAFYLNKQFALFKQDIETNVGTFMTHPAYGVGAVDNISGLLTGDVNVGNTAYAIKSAGATVLGDTDILNLAAALAGMPVSEITQTVLTQVQANLNSMAAQGRNKLNEAVSGEVDEILQSVVNSLNSNTSRLMKVSAKLT